MKLLPLYLLFFFILLTHAQRRTTAKPSTEAESPKPASRGRGRSRFVSSPEYTKLTESSTESTSRKPIVSRRRPIENVEQKIQPRASLVTSSPRPLTVDRRVTSIGETADRIFLKDNVDRKQTPKLLNSVTTAPLAERTQIIERKPFRTLNKRPKKTYEVEEVIKDDVDSFRRPKKQPRVLTEMNFRATNFPKNEEFSKLSKNLVTPEPSSTSNNIQGNTNLVEEQPQDTTIKPELETSLDSLTEGEPKEEISKSVSVSSTSKPTEAPRVQSSNRRNGLRRVVSRVADPSPPTPTVPRGRSRSRPTQAPDYYFQAVSTSVPSSSFRRRVDSLFSSIEPRNGPSVFNADSTASESRARTGRKIELPPEKISLDIPSRSRRLSTTPKSIKSTSIPTFRSRDGRFRSQRMPVIDEQKLEVLPLFEEEPKLVSTRASRINDNFDSRKKGSDNANNKSRGRVTFREKPAKKEDTDSKSRRRGFHVDNIETSATETDMKVTKFTEASPRLSVSVNADTRTESVKPASSNHKTEIKESVTSEINEVTSRRKVSRKKVIVENKQKDVPVFRGNKKSEVKVVKKHSSEEIGESDNYPEEFKALIKANKGQKESRASAPPSSTLSTAIVTSSTPSTIVYQLTTREINNNDNELKPKPSTPSAIVSSPRWNRSRSLPSTTTQTTPIASSDKRQLFKSTSPTTSTSKRTRYRHPTSLYLNSEAMKIKLENNASFKQRVSNKENEVKRLSRGRGTRPPPNSSLFSTKVPKYSTTAKKVDRGKYRSGSTTNVPKYIPTIPSVLYVPTVPFVTAPKSTANTWSGNPTLVNQ